MPPKHPESGNLIFMILLAVVLIGYLSVAIMKSGNSDGANIDSETVIIQASQIRSYVGELERGIRYIQQNNNLSEEDFRFAHSDANADYGDITTNPQFQMFHRDGGGASYRRPPSGINDGSPWEFYGGTAAPAVGSDRADLIAVLPNVTQAFCEYINTSNSQPATLSDTGTCLHQGASGRFNSSTQFDSSPNTMDENAFAQDTTISAVKPAPQACVTCASDGANHFYHVIYAR
jgi:hypothetical protein